MKKIATIIATCFVLTQTESVSAQSMSCSEAQGYSSNAQPQYCPQTHGFVQLGMTENQALSACGTPQKRERSNRVAMKRIPVEQLIYSSTTPANPYPGLKSAFYTQFTIPTGAGIMYNLEIEIVNNKVYEIRNNGSDGINGSNLCQKNPNQGPNESSNRQASDGNSIQKGDSYEHVIAACGNPDSINYSCKDVPIPSNNSPEVWIYQVDQYQPPFTLTFIDGVLRCINNC